MKRTILAAVVAGLAAVGAAWAQWQMPARQVSVSTNTWSVLSPTQNNAQATFQWIDDNWGDYATWSGLAATNNETLDFVSNNYWTVTNQVVFSNYVVSIIPVMDDYVTAVTNMGTSPWSTGLVSEVSAGIYGIWFPTGGTGTTTASSNTYYLAYERSAGSIAAFGGTNVPTGWLVCDGTAYSAVDYPDLWAAIGTNWGGTGSTNFYVPDLRGYFLRGWDNGAGNDPDASSRTTGDMVGSYQGYTNAAHTHTVDVDADVFGYGTNLWEVAITNDAASWMAATNALTSGVTNSFTTASSGGSEARPINAYVMFCIKATNSTNGIGDLATMDWVTGHFLPGTNIVGATYDSNTLTWTISATNYFGTPYHVQAYASSLAFCNTTLPAGTSLACQNWTGLSAGTSMSNWFTLATGVFKPDMAGWYLLTGDISSLEVNAHQLVCYVYVSSGLCFPVATGGEGNQAGSWAILAYFDGTTTSSWLCLRQSSVGASLVKSPYNDVTSAMRVAHFGAFLLDPD